MIVKISKGVANGQITAPPSKSYAHRLLISSALTKSGCKVNNVAFNNDILETLNCLKSLGANFIVKENSVEFFSCDLGKNKNFICNESGSTLRFLIPISMVYNESVVFSLGERLFNRGISVYEEIFKEKGIKIHKEDNKIVVSGKLTAGNYKVRGDVSSQFISGLLFSLPLLEGDSTIEVLYPFESKNYVDITLDVLKEFGIHIERKENFFYVKGNQKYLEKDTFVEGDYSNSAFFHALNYLGGNVLINGLNKDSKQGDKEYLQVFERLKNKDFPINLSNIPDLAPIVFCLSASLQGGTFVGTKRLELKESDRRKCVKEELEKLGITLNIDGDLVSVDNNISELKSIINSHNDHRICMAFAIILTQIGGKIAGAESVNKSYPNFFDELSKLGIGIEYEY